MSKAVDNAVTHLRDLLLALKPTATKGFEGLTADALSAITGLTIRLANSGSQDGRDGSSAPSDKFAISLEAKLYKQSLSLETLAGKSVVAGFYLGGNVDLWAVTSTAEISDQILSKIVPILEEQGVSVLPLDWTATPLPRLAVLLASQKERVLEWYAQNAAAVDQAKLDDALSKIAGDPSFEGQLDQLKNDVAAAKVGLGSLREKSAEWHLRRFADPALSQIAFGQKITVDQPGKIALPRTALVEELDSQMLADPAELSVVALLGGEGAGKTWLGVQWWKAQVDRPIFILVAGRRVELIDPKNPTHSLARLIADQEGRADEASIANWVRRLQRWKSQSAGDKLRFVLMLDGLNERALTPWSDIIRGMAREAQELGGLVIASSREAFWKRDVLPKIKSSVTVRPVKVTDYTDDELKILLEGIGKTLDDLPQKVRSFIRNPRVCAVALSVLDRLVIQAGELTVERLLLEYWQSRLEDRSDGLHHNIDDFHSVLKKHAKEWLEKGPTFDRDDWAEKSGAARRLGPSTVLDDLTEIEEGRFLTITDASLSRYEFRGEALPFALGLLINDEMKRELAAGDSPPDEILNRMIDPVRGFDQIADIFTAATGLACLDEGFPPAGRRALILSWLRLQNIRDEAFEAMGAYLPVKPAAFLDIAEMSSDELGRESREELLLQLLIYHRDGPAIQDALNERLLKWLGAWSRKARRLFNDAAQNAQRQEKRDTRIADALKTFTDSDLQHFEKHTFELSKPSAILLDRAAAMIVAGRSQERIADGIWGWGLAGGLAGDYPDGEKELAWAVRLNTIDWPSVRSAVSALAEKVDENSPEAIRKGAAYALRLMGDKASSDRADELHAREPGQTFRRVENFCSCDPFDPSTTEPDNLNAAREAIKAINPAELWQHMSTTGDDHDLRDASAGLIRFDPAPLIAKLNEVAATAPSRKGLPLRQLGWHLPWLAPVLSAEAKAAIFTTFEKIIDTPSLLPKDDQKWVVGQYAGGLIPTASATEQIDLLLKLPSHIPLYYNFLRGARPLSAKDLERYLEAGFAEGLSSHKLRWVLFFAGATTPSFTKRAREIVLEAIRSDDKMVRFGAGEVIAISQDKVLYEEFVRAIETANEPLEDDQGGLGRAISSAAAALGRDDLLDRVPPRFLGWTVSKLGGDAFDTLGRQVEKALDRLLTPIKTQSPVGIEIVYETSDDDLDASKRFEEVEDNAPKNLREYFERLGDDLDHEKFSNRQREIHREVKAYEKALSKEDATELVSAPPRGGLVELAAREPEMVRKWLQRILEVTSPAIMWQVHNIALTLASAMAQSDGVLAATVFAKFRDQGSSLNVLIGSAKIPLYHQALFAAGDIPELNQLREELFEQALKDSDLEQAVAAIENYGRSEWLDHYVQNLLTRPEPACTARALTISGFRTPNLRTEELLAENWGGGFLGQVARAAREAYKRAQWSEHWLKEMAAADSPVDMWRSAQLLEGVADRRVYPAIKRISTYSEAALSYQGELAARLVKACEKREKKRSDTLFGIKAPDPTFVALLRDPGV